MKTILCYGDSNTYGYNPHNGGRYDKHIRWITILSKLLGDDYDVIPEGLNGRTTAYDREGEDVKNGLTHYRAIYGSHRPVDILIFMLGTNDCNADMNLSVDEIANGMERLIVLSKDAAMQKQGYLPKIILTVPAAIAGEYEKSPLSYQLSIDSLTKSKQIVEPYKQLAVKYDCIFLDASDLKVSEIDCEHLTEESHDKLAHMFFEVIKGIK